MACCTVGLIPDALLGVQGAAFVCLPILRVLALLFYLPPCPLPTQPPSWHLLSTHLKPTCGDGGWQCPLHPKAPSAKASSFLLADPPGR